MLTRNRNLAVMLLVAVIILSACDIRIDLGFPSKPPPAQPTQVQAPAAAPTPIPTASEPAATAPPAIPAGWQTFHSDANGFEIAYPPSYQALNDADSLSGWPKCVLLLYNGGQSYDIAIQVWDSMAEYKTTLGASLPRVVVYPAGSRFISVFNVTEEPDNAAVIATFRLLD